MNFCEGFRLEVSQPIRCRDPQSVRRVDYWESENQPLTLINWNRAIADSLFRWRVFLWPKALGTSSSQWSILRLRDGSADDAVHLGDRRPAGGWTR